MELKEEHEVIQRIAKGESGRSIAKSMGKSEMAISRAKHKNKDKIAKEAERLISCLPDIMEQTIRDINLSNEVSKELSGDTEVVLHDKFKDKGFLANYLSLSYKKQADILRALGIYNSNAPSVAINTLIHADKVEVSPVIIKALGEYLGDSLNAVDADIVDVENKE